MTQSDLELLERVNPVFNTAKTTLYQLAMIGNRDAEELASKLGLTYDQTQNSESVAVEQDAMLQAGLIMMETRYRSMLEMALASGCPVVVDLPCGYTPRALECARLGKMFVGLDLPAAIAEAEPAIRSMLQPEEQDLVHFGGVDATNYASMKEAFDKIDGAVCITTEGLLMYFTESEVAAFVDNIKRILDEHGGCWITADPECVLQYVMNMRAMVGDDIGKVLMRDKAKMEDKSDIKMDANSLRISAGPQAREGMQKAISFLAARGLKVDRIPVADYMPELNSLNMVSAGQAEQIRQAMKQCCYWKMTSTGAASQVHEETDEFSVTALVDGDDLRMKLTGRVDTLTAPKVLHTYETLAEEHSFKSIFVDCKEMEYISSAGLRVWLIMHKACSDGMTLADINDLVADILEQTGYDQFLRIIRTEDDAVDA